MLGTGADSEPRQLIVALIVALIVGAPVMVPALVSPNDPVEVFDSVRVLPLQAL